MSKHISKEVKTARRKKEALRWLSRYKGDPSDVISLVHAYRKRFKLSLNKSITEVMDLGISIDARTVRLIKQLEKERLEKRRERLRAKRAIWHENLEKQKSRYKGKPLSPQEQQEIVREIKKQIHAQKKRRRGPKTRPNRKRINGKEPNTRSERSSHVENE